MRIDSKRREILKYSGLAALGATAGCLGSGGDGGESGGSESDGTDGESGGGSGASQTSADVADHFKAYGADDIQGLSVGKAFNEATGIDIETTVLPGNQSTTRYLQEQQAGEHIPDIIWTLPENTLSIADAGLLADPEIENKDEVYPDDLRQFFGNVLGSEESANKLVPVGSVVSAFTYNTDLVSDPPTSYEDLLEPRFEGEIILAAFNVNSLYDQVWRMNDQEYADEYIQKLDDQNPEYVNMSPLSIIEDIGAGRAKVTTDAYATHTAMYKQDGTPVDYSFASSLWAYYQTAVLVDTAKRAGAAKKFLEFATDKEGQEAVQQTYTGMRPVHEDLEHGNPDIRDAIADKEIRPMDQATERNQEISERLEELIEISSA